MNLQHVSELEKDHFVLNNGEEVPISRRNLSQAKKTGLFRFFGESAEGVSFAIIIGNLFVPLIERYTVPKAFGKEGKANG